MGLQYLPVLIARLCALNLSFVKKERTYLLILDVYLHLQWNAVLAQIVLCLAEAFYEIVDFLA